MRNYHPFWFFSPNIWWSSMGHPPHESECPEHGNRNAWECYFTHPLHLMRSFCQWCEKNSLTVQGFFFPFLFFPLFVHQCKSSKSKRHLFNETHLRRERAASMDAAIGCESRLWGPGPQGAESNPAIVHFKKRCWCRAPTDTPPCYFFSRRHFYRMFYIQFHTLDCRHLVILMKWEVLSTFRDNQSHLHGKPSTHLVNCHVSLIHWPNSIVVSPFTPCVL